MFIIWIVLISLEDLKTSWHIQRNFPQSILDLTVLHPTGGDAGVWMAQHISLKDTYTCG
jgi:hypothetical protein